MIFRTLNLISKIIFLIIIFIFYLLALGRATLGRATLGTALAAAAAVQRRLTLNDGGTTGSRDARDVGGGQRPAQRTAAVSVPVAALLLVCFFGCGKNELVVHMRMRPSERFQMLHPRIHFFAHD